MKPPDFFAELKRRNVLRAAAFYAASAWLLVQVATQVFPFFHIAEWVVRAIVLAACIGFPFAMLFSWFYEWTPQGIQRESQIPPDASITRQTGKKLDRWIIAILLLAVVLLLTDKLVFRPNEKSNALALAAIPEKSIAVLPFENLSAEKENTYFVEGIQDEILTRLAKISALKVISRTSTMRYASRPDNLREIGKQLGVATILEGSVQRAEGSMRVNLQLIDAASDTHLWAETYDREVKNIFSVESEVAQKVADALKAKLAPAESARVASVPTKNPAAYDLFLQGQYLFNQLQTSSAKDPVAAGQAARDFYRKGIAVDGDFALAYARLSYLESYLHWYGVDTSSAVVDDARAHAERALALQPDLPEAHLALGYVHYWCHRDYPAALSEFAIARASLPNDPQVIAAIGYVHRRQGVASRGIPEMQQASLLDPRDSTLAREIANSYTALRQYAEAETYYARSLALVPDDMEALAQRATSTMFSGDMEAADRMLTAISAGVDPQGSISLLRFKLAMILRQPEKALATIAHSPDWLMTRWEHSVAPVALLRGQALSLKGETGAARADFLDAERQLKPLLDEPSRFADANSYLGLVYAGLGQKEAALQGARAAVQRLPMSRDVIVGAFHFERLARVEAQVGEIGSAIGHLEALMSSAGGETVSIATLRIDPVWDPLRQDPRFQALLTKYGASARGATP
jgi:TolB-like protein/Tfp pilus assembly protein PilF